MPVFSESEREYLEIVGAIKKKISASFHAKKMKHHADAAHAHTASMGRRRMTHDRAQRIKHAVKAHDHHHALHKKAGGKSTDAIHPTTRAHSRSNPM